MKKGFIRKKDYLSCIAKSNLLFIGSFFPWLVFVNLGSYYASTNVHIISMSKQNSLSRHQSKMKIIVVLK